MYCLVSYGTYPLLFITPNSGEMPTHDEVIAAMSGRSAGIVGRNCAMDLSEKVATQVCSQAVMYFRVGLGLNMRQRTLQEAAIAMVEKAVRVIAPYKKQDHKVIFGSYSPRLLFTAVFSF
jgi:hypothetical protein